MNKILLSHVDLDGCGIIVLAEYFHRYLLFDDILMLDYDFEKNENIVDYINDYSEIVIADLTLPEEDLKKFKSNVSLFDHHSETEWISSYNDSVWDKNRCGTKIFWEEYVKPRIKRYPPIVDYFVDLVNVYDQWNLESNLWEEAKNLNSVLYGLKNYSSPENYGKALPFFHLMKTKFDKLKEWRWTSKEQRIIESSKEKEDAIFEKCKNHISIRVDSQKKLFGVIMLSSKISLVASRILHEFENLDYLVAINSYGGVQGKLSLRSKNGFNCNNIHVAKGHDAAAGARLSVEDTKRFWEENDLALKYNIQITDDESELIEKVVQEI